MSCFIHFHILRGLIIFSVASCFSKFNSHAIHSASHITPNLLLATFVVTALLFCCAAVLLVLHEDGVPGHFVHHISLTLNKRRRRILHKFSNIVVKKRETILLQTLVYQEPRYDTRYLMRGPIVEAYKSLWYDFMMSSENRNQKS